MSWNSRRLFLFEIELQNLKSNLKCKKSLVTLKQVKTYKYEINQQFPKLE